MLCSTTFRVSKDQVEKLCTSILDSTKISASASTAVSEKKTAQFYRKLLSKGVSPKPKIKPENAEVRNCTLTVNLLC